MSFDNRGAVWPNTRKAKDTDPDFTGTLEVDGVEYGVNAWHKADGASPGAPAMKFSVYKKKAKGEPVSSTVSKSKPDWESGHFTIDQLRDADY